MRTATRRNSNRTSQTAIYRLEPMPSALADMKALPAKVRERVGAAVGRLAGEPAPMRLEAARGALAAYRALRVGNYRASYTVDQKARLIQVWRVGHRSTFYKRMQH